MQSVRIFNISPFFFMLFLFNTTTLGQPDTSVFTGYYPRL